MINSLILAIILFIVSYGSLMRLRLIAISESEAGILRISFFSLFPLFMVYLSIHELVEYKWYWEMLITILVVISTRGFLSQIYIKYFGIKTAPTFSLKDGDYIRYNHHPLNAIISFLIGLVIYLISVLT